LLQLVNKYPRAAPPAERCAFIARELGLDGPADPERLFAVGEYMPCECLPRPRGPPAPAYTLRARPHTAVCPCIVILGCVPSALVAWSCLSAEIGRCWCKPSSSGGMCAIQMYMKTACSTHLAASEDRTQHEFKHASLMWYAGARCVCCPVPADLPGGSPAKALWRLHEAIEVMADTYCGSLALEYTHLQQQDEMAWMQQRFEGKQPLTGTQKRQVSSGLRI